MSNWEHLETASNIVRRRNPPRIPWAITLHLSFRTRMTPRWTKNLGSKRYLVAELGVPIMFCPERHTRGSMVTSWGMASSTSTFLRSPNLILTCLLHLTKSSCQELTSGTYFTITLLGKDGLRWRPPPLKTPWREAQPREHSATESKVHKWRWSGVR